VKATHIKSLFLFYFNFLEISERSLQNFYLATLRNFSRLTVKIS
jgi:hypothetical protein